jgi:putative heme-binding domain-containing protein
LPALWDKPPMKLAEAVKQARALFDQAAVIAVDGKRPVLSRVEAVQLLGRGPFKPLEGVAAKLLSPLSPPLVQLAVVRALSAHARPEVPGLLLATWSSASPTLRRELAEALFARRERVAALVEAMEKKKVLAAHLEAVRLARLRTYPDAKLRARALAVLAKQQAPLRVKVIESYRASLKLKGDLAMGKKVFQKNCSTCHRLDGVGKEVGPDLVAVLRNKSAEQLLIDILDPSREVDARYLAYEVMTTRGLVLSGMIASETASSLTLRRGEGLEDTILRTQIEKVVSTGQSLMPDGLEIQLSRQDMADVIAYLLKAGQGK